MNITLCSCLLKNYDQDWTSESHYNCVASYAQLGAKRTITIHTNQVDRKVRQKFRVCVFRLGQKKTSSGVLCATFP